MTTVPHLAARTLAAAAAGAVAAAVLLHPLTRLPQPAPVTPAIGAAAAAVGDDLDSSYRSACWADDECRPAYIAATWGGPGPWPPWLDENGMPK